MDVPWGAPSMGALTWALSLNNAGGSAIVTVVSSLFVPVNSAVSTIWSKSSSSNTWGVYSGGKLTGSRLNLGLSLSPNGKINSAVSLVDFEEDRVLRTGLAGEESETKSEIVLCFQQQEIEVSAKSLKPEVDKFKIVDKKCKSGQLPFKIRDVSKTKNTNRLRQKQQNPGLPCFEPEFASRVPEEDTAGKRTGASRLRRLAEEFESSMIRIVMDRSN